MSEDEDIVGLGTEPQGEDAVLALPYTPQTLLEAARRFAGSAAAHYAPTDAPFFFLHAGASTELLLKAALCAASPALLLERQFNDEALIRRVGLQPLGKSGTTPRRGVERPPYTIGLAKAIDRYQLLYGQDSLGVSPEDLGLLKAARDLAAHGSNAPDVTQEMHVVLVTFAKVVNSVVARLRMSDEEFWGAHTFLVSRALDEQRGQVASRARTLISAARQRFETKYDGVPRESLERLMTETFWELNPKPNEWSRVCPACGAQGVSRVRADLWREATPEETVRLVAGYKAIDLRCPICQLTLESEELWTRPMTLRLGRRKKTICTTGRRISAGSDSAIKTWRLWSWMARLARESQRPDSGNVGRPVLRAAMSDVPSSERQCRTSRPPSGNVGRPVLRAAFPDVGQGAPTREELPDGRLR
ncbi:hypothetical protein [Humibacillus xanthopallidus]|uniref:hypothetical protein n=1 Tax=Humibacillus xanthopallidus TaxID=412689 RepID=UPI0031E0C6A5